MERSTLDVGQTQAGFNPLRHPFRRIMGTSISSDRAVVIYTVKLILFRAHERGIDTFPPPSPPFAAHVARCVDGGHGNFAFASASSNY